MEVLSSLSKNAQLLSFSRTYTVVEHEGGDWSLSGFQKSWLLPGWGVRGTHHHRTQCKRPHQCEWSLSVPFKKQKTELHSRTSSTFNLIWSVTLKTVFFKPEQIFNWPCVTCRLANLCVRDWNVIQYHFQSLHGGDVDEGDGREVQDEAVDVHPGHLDVAWKISVPVYPEEKVLDVSGQVQRVNLQGIKHHVFLYGDTATYYYLELLTDLNEAISKCGWSVYLWSNCILVQQQILHLSQGFVPLPQNPKRFKSNLYKTQMMFDYLYCPSK